MYDGTVTATRASSQDQWTPLRRRDAGPLAASLLPQRAGARSGWCLRCTGRQAHPVTSREAEPSNGLVSVYLGAGDGLACNAANGGKFEVRGLQDGGWYWITDAMNSAVASLVAKDALGNTAVMPTDPGSSDITLTKMEGGSSTLVKQASTGRIGILHHVLPEPVMEVEEMPHCMPMKSGTKWVSKETGCLLGDGKTKIVDDGDGGQRSARRGDVLAHQRCSGAARPAAP